MFNKIKSLFIKADLELEKPRPIPEKEIEKIIFKENVSKIHKILLENILEDNKKYTMIHGFTKLECMADFPNNRWSNPYVPCVTIVDNESGELRSFAVGILMPTLILKSQLKDES